MDKATKLADLKKRLQEDQSLPLRSTATQLVFGDGSPDADIYFLGEAPGYYEDQEGRPFVGAAGKLLNKMLENIGVERNNVYISNVVRFRPPNNRDPEPAELEAFAPYVDEEIDIIQPKLIVTLGRFSMGKFMPEVRISQVHGKARVIDWHGRKLTVLPMYHPAAALRAGEVMKVFQSDFMQIPDLLKGVQDKESTKPEEEKTENAADKPKQLELI